MQPGGSYKNSAEVEATQMSRVIPPRDIYEDIGVGGLLLVNSQYKHIRGGGSVSRYSCTYLK